jgi:hypothetical protein
VDENASVTRYTSVRVAYVFADGYETPMGPVSEEIGYVPGDTLVVAPVDEALLPIKPSAIRLYIAVAGTDDVQWKYLGEFKDVSYATEIVLENDIAGEIMEVYDTYCVRRPLGRVRVHKLVEARCGSVYRRPRIPARMDILRN